MSLIDDIRSNRLTKKELLLLLSLMVFAFIPSINQLIVDSLVSGMGSDVLTIAGQLEWFDLFNETLLAFLIVPMYFVFNKAKDDSDLSKRINTTFGIGFILYTAVSLIIYAYASGLTSYMSAPAESVNYLRLETVGFIIGYISSYMYVVFVIRGRSRYFWAMLIAKITMLSIGNSLLIPQQGVTGIAVTNICVNIILSVISVALLYREGLIRRWSGIDRDVLKEWCRTGLFSGGQVLIANLIYMFIVVKMINDVSQVGNYWLANNFIWGWLLIPVAAVGEMVKREFRNGYRRIWNYVAVTTIILIVWVLTVPLWGIMFTDVIHANDPNTILEILYKLVPFYAAYAFSTVLQSVMTSVGRTDLILLESAIVNFVYYGIMYGLFLAGVFTASLDFVIFLFGVGLVVCLVLDVIFYRISEKTESLNILMQQTTKR